MRAHPFSFVVAVLFSSMVVMPAHAAQVSPSLTAADKKYLDDLMKEFLFDPNGAERVAVKTVVRTIWKSSEEMTTEGWFVAGNDGKSGQVFSTDGALIPAPADKEMKKLDFLAVCKARYTEATKKKDAKEERAEVSRQYRQIRVGEVAADDLTLAAWLYRLGDEGLAARALAVARRSKDDPRKRLREALAWSAFARMVHAYMVRADEEALAHGERLQRLYSAEAKQYSQTHQIIAELKRRQKKGTFGKAPPDNWPVGFDNWDARKKTAYLIDALEEIDVRQLGQPNGVDLASDRRVAELVRLGDGAVPVLIDTLENDERLTRSVHCWRDFHQSRTVLGVREAALTALMCITRVHVFEPVSTGDNFTTHGDNPAREAAKRLRAYWKQNGNIPFDERTMKVLMNPNETSSARREAAVNLATLNANRRIQTTLDVFPISPGREPNPAIARFNKPTVAEAILASMDADLRAHDAKPQGPDLDADDRERNATEETYLWALGQLNDKRVAPELAKRTAEAEARRRRGPTERNLDDPNAFRSFVEYFRAGKIVLRANDDREFGRMLRALIEARTPEANRALDALANPSHPQHALFAQKILKEDTRSFGRGPWFARPVCLAILRQALDDTSPTGARYSVENNTLWRRELGGGVSETARPDLGRRVPVFLANPDERQDVAQERVCDLAAEKLGDLVAGLPLYHPILKDAEKHLNAFKAAFDRFAGNYRSVTSRELDSLSSREGQSLSTWSPAFIPDISPLGRPATAGDVKAGKAIFHLGGKGTQANQSLPAMAVFKDDEKKEHPRHVLIVQAEVSPDGQVTYGIIMKEAIRAVAARELAAIKAFAELDKQEQDARDKPAGKRD